MENSIGGDEQHAWENEKPVKMLVTKFKEDCLLGRPRHTLH
jgi:hypothetical protein